MSIKEALKQQAKLSEMMANLTYVNDKPNPSKVRTVANKLRARPQLLFDLLRELGTPKLASAWDKHQAGSDRPSWRLRNINGDNLTHIVHAHPESDEDTWHALLLDSNVHFGFWSPEAARAFADGFLNAEGYTLLGESEIHLIGPWKESIVGKEWIRSRPDEMFTAHIQLESPQGTGPKKRPDTWMATFPGVHAINHGAGNKTLKEAKTYVDKALQLQLGAWLVGGPNKPYFL